MRQIIVSYHNKHYHLKIIRQLSLNLKFIALDNLWKIKLIGRKKGRERERDGEREKKRVINQ